MGDSRHTVDDDIWNFPDEEDIDIEYEYLDVERHDHGIELWNLANIFDEMQAGDDTRYQDFHLAIVNNWKVIAFDIARWSGTPGGGMTIDVDLFAVLKVLRP